MSNLNRVKVFNQGFGICKFQGELVHASEIADQLSPSCRKVSREERAKKRSSNVDRAHRHKNHKNKRNPNNRSEEDDQEDILISSPKDGSEELADGDAFMSQEDISVCIPRRHSAILVQDHWTKPCRPGTDTDSSLIYDMPDDMEEGD